MVKNDERLGISKTENPSLFKWCRWWDSNPHGVAPATSTNSITPALFSCCESHFSESAVGQNFRAELTKSPFLGYTEKSIIARVRPVG